MRGRAWRGFLLPQLLEQLEHALGNLVGLGQHGLGGLDQDVVLGVGHHLLGHIGVADGGLRVLDVLGHDGQVVDGVVQTVLGGTQSTADVGHGVDGGLDLVHRGLGGLLGVDLQIADAQGSGVHILHRHVQLVKAVAGVADLKGQALAQHHGSLVVSSGGPDGDGVLGIVDLGSAANLRLEVGGGVSPALGELHVLGVGGVRLAGEILGEHILHGIVALADGEDIALSNLVIVDLNVGAHVLGGGGRRCAGDHRGHVGVGLEGLGGVGGAGGLVDVDLGAAGGGDLPGAAIDGAIGLPGDLVLLGQQVNGHVDALLIGLARTDVDDSSTGRGGRGGGRISLEHIGRAVNGQGIALSHKAGDVDVYAGQRAGGLGLSILDLGGVMDDVAGLHRRAGLLHRNLLADQVIDGLRLSGAELAVGLEITSGSASLQAGIGQSDFSAGAADGEHKVAQLDAVIGCAASGGRQASSSLYAQSSISRKCGLQGRGNIGGGVFTIAGGTAGSVQGQRDILAEHIELHSGVTAAGIKGKIAQVNGQGRGGLGGVAAHLGVQLGVIQSQIGAGDLAVAGSHGGGLGEAERIGVQAQGAIEQLDAVEVGAVANTVDLAEQLVHFLLHLVAVGGVVVGAVGGLGGQLHHTVEHVVNLSQGTLGGLHQGDAVLGVLLGGLQASDLSTHLLRNGQTGGIVTGAVDLVAGGELLQVLLHGGHVVGVVAVGVHRHNVVLNTHCL